TSRLFKTRLTWQAYRRIMEQGIRHPLLTELTSSNHNIFFLRNFSYNINATSATDEGVAQRGICHEIHN
ncbi:MAG: hypothetical protein IJK04_07790, partial [Kiritimatiellae bacterium]|nr:hypothetical protein [Kiritimatiellia bacterium]